ncbi:hypothetical protein IFM89_035392 [Coptis chinensis]|uniref:Protein EARLY FLOWERING 4 domain-containing protein n=1 Tax=Coptis chinensis TaxID=261450 RepID=A0A835HLK1_9MAGN|nr:hypothetical protein IFM89_035392 [Coptis chinensis]
MTTVESSSSSGCCMDTDYYSNKNKTERGDVELWETFSKSFNQVQSVLDQNRVLIQQVNENHQSKLPDNLTKNVSLIREINGNISTVVSLYSKLSANFTHVFHQRAAAPAATGMRKKNIEQSPEA